MTALVWTDAMALGVDVIDHDHAETVTLWAAAAAAEGAAFAAAFELFTQHLVDHFAREEALMKETNFFASSCHAGEHARVLNECARQVEAAKAGRLMFAQAYLREQIPDWFQNHLATMDSVTANHIRQVKAAA